MTRTSVAAQVLAATAVLACASRVDAQAAPQPTSAAPGAAPPAQRPLRSARREMPSFDGRAPAPPTPLAVAAWVPRALAAPIWLIVAGVRAPLGAALRSDTLYSAFGDAAGISVDLSSRGAPRRREFWVAPILVLETGRRVYAGAALGYGAPSTPRNRLGLLAATGGERFFLGELTNRTEFAPGSDAGVRLAWTERPDYWQYGAPGPATRQAAGSTFWMRRAGATATAVFTFARWLRADVASGVRWTELDLTGAAWLSQTSQPARDTYGAFVTDAQLALDTRAPRPDVQGTPAAGRSGVRLVARLHHGVDLHRASERRWLVAEALGGAYLEVMRPGRVLGVEVIVASSSSLGAGPVPFAELPTLGGHGLMRGFLDGRFRGQSVAAAGLVYRWPIWVWLEAQTRLAVGNAFGPGFAGFAPGALFGSWDVAIRTTPPGALQFELLFGLGTSRFDDPVFRIDSARVLAALTRGF